MHNDDDVDYVEKDARQPVLERRRFQNRVVHGAARV